MKLTELINWIATSEDQRDPTSKPDMTMQRAIYDLQCLPAPFTNPIESQTARALLAFCLHLYNEMSLHIALARCLRQLLEAFNEHTDIPRSPWLQRCIHWCAMVTASVWITEIDASPKRHIVLDKLTARLPEARSRKGTEELLRKFLWHDRLMDEWELCWRAAAFRSRWQRKGASQLASLSHLSIENGHYSGTPSSEERF